MKDKQQNNTKLGNYIAYGMSFGLLAGAGLSVIVGTMFNNVFIQMAGAGIGLAVGMMVGALLYWVQNKSTR
ncbi:hypothetical protein [Bacillus alkalicellulosilyticus]|uniref:hypothetical protein n=1 Tax=Alkalihalobacterium alkalicellulosilyticum TaxID=1912214 RepID=UPI0009966125|nr:hypothetical protein [Bacillus alkalicellulosilyticus]